MGFLTKLINYLSLGLAGKIEEKALSSILFISLLSLAGTIFLFLFGIYAFATARIIPGILLMIASFLVAGSLAYVRRTRNWKQASIFNLALIIVVLFAIFTSEKSEGSVIIWFAAIPVLSVFILGNRGGAVVSLSFLVITTIFLLLPESFIYRPEFSATLLVRFYGLYSGLYIIAAIVEYYRVTNLNAAEVQLLEARNETKLKEAFISRLSHQIRTPLSNIMLVSHMVNKVDLSEEQKDMMETIIASANNLVNTIENIAEIAEVDIESKKRAQTTGFNLHTTINSIIRLFTVQKEPVIEFALNVDEDLKYQELEGDPVRLKQIFLNLIETILKNKRPGKIIINIVADIQGKISDITEIRFEIKTSKPINLPNGDREYGKRALAGSGPGSFIHNIDLNIARKLITQLGGILHVLQTQEKNQVFLFTLPFRSTGSLAVKTRMADTGKKTAQAEGDSRDILKDINLLLVEDNTINQKIVVLSLNKFIPNIDVANNGKEALDKFGTSKYDIILMDVQMPVIDGFVATRKIREIEATTHSHTPIIAITANALHGDREKCLASGMDDYISKPFQVEVLIDKIKNLIQYQA